MTTPEQPRPLLERCWYCNERILRDDATRVLPGFGLNVHTRCYKAATEPPPSPPTAA
ncbi:MAG TPA: hypothetical protein VE932_08680 [Patescibacteria group bacterium]|nr:hypothetical protein [Patescibacteria group bacterium]